MQKGPGVDQTSTLIIFMNAEVGARQRGGGGRKRQIAEGGWMHLGWEAGGVNIVAKSAPSKPLHSASKGQHSVPRSMPRHYLMTRHKCRSTEISTASCSVQRLWDDVINPQGYYRGPIRRTTVVGDHVEATTSEQHRGRSTRVCHPTAPLNAMIVLMMPFNVVR